MANKLAQEAGLIPNRPSTAPPDLDYLKAHLKEKNAELIARYEQLIASFNKAPETITSDELQGNVADLNKMLRTLQADLENQRKLEKQPWDTVAATVHAFFVNLTDTIKAAREKLGERQEAYTKRKADEERLKAQEEAERRRKEAEEALRIAAEAEAKRVAAEKAQREAEERAAAAERERKEAIERAERAEREAADARRREAEAAERQLEEQARAAQAKKEADEAAEKQAEAARLQREEAERAARKAKEEAQAQARKVNEEKAAAAAAAGEVKVAAREEKTYLQQAVRAEDRAVDVAEVARASDAELGRVRSEHGTVATVQKRWTYAIDNFDALQAAVLWPLVARDAKEAAVSRYVQQGGRKLNGVRIYEEQTGVAR